MSAQPLRVDLAHAEHALLAAEWASSPGERYAHAQLAALRTAAVVLASRARPRPGARRGDAWVLLSRVAPELAEWAGYFRLTQSRALAVRQALAQRRTPPVTERQADDLLRDAQQFHAVVARSLVLGGAAVARGGGA